MKVATFLSIIFIKIVNIFGANEEENGDTSTNADEYFKKCFEELGCIEVNSKWYHEKYRPVNLKPLDRMIIKTDFILIHQNSSNPKSNLFYTTIIITPKSVEVSGYVKNGSLFLLVHDFTSNGYTGWIKHLAKILLSKKKSINIVSVDWQKGAQPPYDQTISNARVVALEIIQLIKILRENKEVELKDIHIIGHGVGAHIAGYVGSSVGKIKKITGLDPSGPRFEGMPKEVKLDPMDAEYVEVLHTDGYAKNSQGSKENFGHSDFFINKAEKQSGCKKEPTQSVLNVKPGNLAQGEIFPGCSHKRSFKYFIEALESGDCAFLGLPCNGSRDFSEGKCTECDKNCRTFGLHTYQNSTPATFYLNTAPKLPFCLFQYKVTLMLSSTKTEYKGYFVFILIDINDQATSSSKADERKFFGGKNNTLVFYAGKPKVDSKIKEARVGWKGKTKGLCLFGCKNAVFVEKFYVKRLLVGDGRKNKEQSTLCPKDNVTEILDQDYQTFLPC